MYKDILYNEQASINIFNYWRGSRGGGGGGGGPLLNLGRDKGGGNGIMRWHKVCSTHEIQRSTTENLQLPHPAFLSLTIAMAKDAA